MSTQSLNAVHGLEQPEKLTELRTFLLMCNIFGYFIPNVNCVVVKFNINIQKGQTQTFERLSDEEIIGLDMLKENLIEPPVLRLPRSQVNYTVDQCTRGKQIYLVLLQKKPDGTNRPIWYWSRPWNDTEKAYDTTPRECLAVVWAALLLLLYFEGCQSPFCTGSDAESESYI